MGIGIDCCKDKLEGCSYNYLDTSDFEDKCCKEVGKGFAVVLSLLELWWLS